MRPTDLPDLVAFWDFQEPHGNFVSQGVSRRHLIEQDGAVERVEEGIFGVRSIRLGAGPWLCVPRAVAGPLNIHGPQAQVSVVA